jgi:hypothetical protein
VINATAKAMRNKNKKTKMENRFTPFQVPVRSMINWWKKEGSFNVELYLALCKAKEN